MKTRCEERKSIDNVIWISSHLDYGCLCCGCLCVKRRAHCTTAWSTHTSCSAQGQMVHLLGERAHHAGRLHGHSVVHGWRDHCTLVEQGEETETVRRKRGGTKENQSSK